MKFESAAQDNIDKLQPYVDRILEALGHPEAFVTDESIVGDFINVFSTKEERYVVAAQLSSKLGLVIETKDYIYKIAERLRDANAEGRSS